MNYETLYVIGNGFDLHHGVKSSYHCYMEWLKENHKDDYQKIIDFYGNEAEEYEWWNEFETNLGYFDIREKVENWAFLNQPNDKQLEDMKIDVMAGAWDAQTEIDGIMSILKDSFHEWIDSLKPALSANKIVIDSQNAYFINFNYSLTLENVYNVPSAQILHIHGCLNDDEYIIGHGRTYEEVKEDAEPYIPPFDSNKDDPSEYGLDAIDDEITEHTKTEAVNKTMEAAKPTDEIIKKNRSIFDQLSEVNKVCIYGLSFSSVDEHYLNHIISSVAPKAKLEASYYSLSDKESIKKFARKHNLSIRLVCLEDLQVVKQLRLF